MTHVESFEHMYVEGTLYDFNWKEHLFLLHVENGIMDLFYTRYIYLQSIPVISTSIISNHRLSRRENLVIVLTQKSKIRLQNIVEKRRKLLLGSNFSPFPQCFQYIFLTQGVKLHTCSHL